LDVSYRQVLLLLLLLMMMPMMMMTMMMARARIILLLLLQRFLQHCILGLHLHLLPLLLHRSLQARSLVEQLLQPLVPLLLCCLWGLLEAGAPSHGC
jgi:Na+-transporting NADH:ubiquinone oxidoreductase subunit NqrB